MLFREGAQALMSFKICISRKIIAGGNFTLDTT